ncbi:hypothetical protein [Amycolatopsis rubida]|uniref:Uncharacterized protein n=1 Tax=Amycolatopsis rubida TaxID=112413 RepID=A0A1I5YKH1_9PSEU|nr:hypothetical protein [Amycolatopsis rubida]SFQ44688.1 hypothetical protein SAMN05421854_112159 [Amycolatopsis rubida]
MTVPEPRRPAGFGDFRRISDMFAWPARRKSLPGERPDIQWRSIKVMAEWSARPVWFFNPYTHDVSTPADPASPELGLGAEPARDLAAWQDEWDVTRTTDGPASCAFPSEEAGRRFDERGRELTRRVRREVPVDWDVSCLSHLTNREVLLD